MTVAVYLIAYMFMSAAAIRLRYTASKLARPFSVPGGAAGMWLVAGVGFVGVLFSFIAALFPPDQLPVGSPTLYVSLVVIGTVVFCGIPLIIHQMRRPEWAPAHDQNLIGRSYPRRAKCRTIDPVASRPEQTLSRPSLPHVGWCRNKRDRLVQSVLAAFIGDRGPGPRSSCDDVEGTGARHRLWRRDWPAK